MISIISIGLISNSISCIIKLTRTSYNHDFGNKRIIKAHRLYASEMKASKEEGRVRKEMGKKNCHQSSHSLCKF